MNGAEFVDVFCGDEGVGGAQVALRDIAANQHGITSVSYNVWILHVDAPHDVLRYEHDFLPDDGSMPLSEFVDGLRGRLGASGNPG